MKMMYVDYQSISTYLKMGTTVFYTIRGQHHKHTVKEYITVPV
jgi:hypothetical protein